MPDLPDMVAPERRAPDGGVPWYTDTAISLKDRDYVKARAIPGAIYSSDHKAVILPVVTPRAAIVALQLFPDLGTEYPELIDARDSLMQDVHPTDYATPLGIEIDAPYVHQTLLDDGHDWLVFDGQDSPALDGIAPTQSTDLGYAAAILRKHGAFYLGWARGYGKTLGTAAIIEANDYERVLIAVPNTAKQDVWLRELQKRNRTHQIIVLGNTPEKRAGALRRVNELAAEGTPFIFVVHHEALRLIAGSEQRPSGKGYTVTDGWKQGYCTGCGAMFASAEKIEGHRHSWSKMPEWDLFAIDEAHRLKSSGVNGSQIHRAACKVPCRDRLALSGSVYENNWEEPYGVLHWLYPARYSDRWTDWCFRYLDYVEGYGKILVGLLPGREQAMRDELGVFLILREKPDLSIHEQVFVDLSAGQRKAYEELAEDFITQLDDGTAVLAQAGMVMVGRLRQIATGLELLTKRLADSSKLDAAVQLIAESDDDFFVACWYKASAYALEERILEHQHDTAVWVITGDVPQKRRSEIIQETRDAVAAGERVVLIGTIETLGESSNLQHLNHVVRLDRSYNPAKNRQVVDRCDRTGQTRQVYLTDIIARNTVDESVVMPSLANKDAFRAMILGRGA